jgi:hypothetical protein
MPKQGLLTEKKGCTTEKEGSSLSYLFSGKQRAAYSFDGLIPDFSCWCSHCAKLKGAPTT